MATEVPSYSLDNSPYKCIGVIFVTFPDGSAVNGTCSLVGTNDILTAAHVIYNPDRGGWASNITMYFGADYNASTGRFEDLGYQYHPDDWNIKASPNQAFVDSSNTTMNGFEAQYDIAVIGVNSPIGNTLGWLGLDGYSHNRSFANAVGFPNNGTGMMYQVISANSNSDFGIYETPYEILGPGASGGPMLNENKQIIGINSTGHYFADVGFTWDQLMKAMKENDSLLSPPPPTSPPPPPPTSPPPPPIDVGLQSSLHLVYSESGYAYYGGNNIDTISYPGFSYGGSTQTEDGSWRVELPRNLLPIFTTVYDIERLEFGDGTKVALDVTAPTQVAGAAVALWYAYYDQLPDSNALRSWIITADSINDKPVFNQGNLEILAQSMLTSFTSSNSGISNSDLVIRLYTNIVGTAPLPEDLNFFTQSIETGVYTQAGLFAYAAAHELNTEQYADMVAGGLEYANAGKVG